MNRVVELGDKLVFDTSKRGFKVAPDKCEFLDNLIIKNIECEVTYPLDVVRDTIEGESVLEEWMTWPDANCGVKFVFEGILYGKNTQIFLGGPDHADYDEPLLTNWYEALNIIVECLNSHRDDVLSSYVECIETNADCKTLKEYIESLHQNNTIDIFITRDMVVEEIRVNDMTSL